MTLFHTTENPHLALNVLQNILPVDTVHQRGETTEEGIIVHIVMGTLSTQNLLLTPVKDDTLNTLISFNDNI